MDIVHWTTIYTHIHMQNHSSLVKYTSHFIWKGSKGLLKVLLCERELETEQNCNILTPTLMAITAFLSCSPGLLNRWPGGSSLCWLLVFSTASSLQLVWSNWLNFLWTEFDVHLLLVGVTNRIHSTRPRSRLYSDIPRPDAPVIYTGAFPILTASPGSICYKERAFYFA